MLTNPTPAINSTLTRLGIDYLKLKILAGQKGLLGGFRIGDSSAIILNQETNTNVAGNVVYTGTTAEMFVTKFNANEIIIGCVLDETKGPFNIGSIAILSETGIPIFIARFDYIHSKMSSMLKKAGGKWIFQLKFIQASYSSYWDFALITNKNAQAEAFTGSWNTVPSKPIYSINSETIQTDNILGENTNRAGYCLLPEIFDLNWISSPFQMRLDDSKFWKIDGGVDGDSHKYVYP
jgi:ribosomal protein L30E